METHALTKDEKKREKLNQNVQYSHLTNLQLLNMLEDLIEKASTTEGMNTKSATDILLEDRR
ncbi:MAG: hypothetical protein QG641_1604 [Candidatus Poribacteria bacterium]|nr:hypothetical protein [Candidatus Poribacteria bacterium]MDQ1328319.1 hypothetical protein [Candidatus Poribacteria bacterium]